MYNKEFTAENKHTESFRNMADRCRKDGRKGRGMKMKSIAKGATAGAIAGLACYALSAVTPVKKYSIKKDAGKAIKSMGNLLDDIKSVIM